MRLTYCLPDIPKDYAVNLFNNHCRQCGMDFETLLSFRDELVRFEEVGGNEERWLPTYGRGGYLDLIGKIMPGIGTKLATTAPYTFIINELLKNYAEPGIDGNVFSMPLRKQLCPVCGSDDIKPSEPQLLSSPPLAWMKPACTLIDETLLSDCQVWPYWKKTISIKGFYPEAWEDLIGAAYELNSIIARELDDNALGDALSRLVNITGAINRLEEEVLITILEVRNMLSGILGPIIHVKDKQEDNEIIANPDQEKRMRFLSTTLFHSSNGYLSQVERGKLEELEKIAWGKQIMNHPKIRRRSTKFNIGDQGTLQVPFISMSKGYTVTGGYVKAVDRETDTALLCSDDNIVLKIPLTVLNRPVKG